MARIPCIPPATLRSPGAPQRASANGGRTRHTSMCVGRGPSCTDNNDRSAPTTNVGPHLSGRTIAAHNWHGAITACRLDIDGCGITHACAPLRLIYNKWVRQSPCHATRASRLRGLTPLGRATCIGSSAGCTSDLGGWMGPTINERAAYRPELLHNLGRCTQACSRPIHPQTQLSPRRESVGCQRYPRRQPRTHDTQTIPGRCQKTRPYRCERRTPMGGRYGARRVTTLLADMPACTTWPCKRPTAPHRSCI